MESLQEKVSAVPVKAESRGVRDETKPQNYQGLTLVGSVDYHGGTSIKYWM